MKAEKTILLPVFSCSRMLLSVWLPMLMSVTLLPGADPCQSCHPREVQGFAQSAMAKSLRRPGKEPEGSFQAGGKTFTIASNGHGMTQRMERGGQAVEFPVAYVLGSGNRGSGYLVKLGDELFQSPIGYYPTRKAYDVAPGFESMDPDFTRPITEECLLCHAGKVKHVAGSINRYEKEPFADEAITCERCHGSAERHLKNPSRGSIVNPAKLERAARDSVCEQCHLDGLIRVANPGMQLADYRPGQRLEDVYTTYVAAPEAGGANDAFKSISHSEQLALSACARNSGGKFWCATCHDPHNRPAETAAYYASRCLSCHTGKLGASHPAGADCVSCHMSQRQAKDGGHSVFTDHRIQRHPGTSAPAPTEPELAAWRKPGVQFGKRNLALAYLNLALEEGSAARILRGQEMVVAVQKAFPDDPAIFRALGAALLYERKPREAIAAFERVEQLSPGDVGNEQNLGTSWLAVGDPDRAAQHLERALELNPLLLPTAKTLATIYQRQGRADMLTALSNRMRDAMK